jgi:hypothetical protein
LLHAAIKIFGTRPDGRSASVALLLSHRLVLSPS